ncbi:DUF5462 family protein [Vibrio panuliri]|uniref:Fimbrial protein n=1 Tax=Vibrio panuliri TaxID=1381081 RepID=A0ABX3F467_9VIBR|nr:DUF5462 family protein [Vibrio panuliri]KAB1457261.1 hypothetical protein F7O85_05830 [Vibrio panuliri]OLQ84740.1 hypothetical protein BIY20_17125 [Vibrio panuliri]
MKKSSAIVALWIGLVIASLSFAETLILPDFNNALGTVNGDVVNEEVQIAKSLVNPVLLSVRQAELSAPLQTIVIKDVQLIQQSGGAVEILLTTMQRNQRIRTHLSLGLWLDDEAVNMSAKASGSSVLLTVPAAFKQLEVRAMSPLSITLPVSFKGPFQFDIEIEGQS